MLLVDLCRTKEIREFKIIEGKYWNAGSINEDKKKREDIFTSSLTMARVMDFFRQKG
jgi:hypothetical protein